MQTPEEMYRQYAQTVYKYLLSKTGSEDLAEELTQETFYQAIRGIDRFDGSCQVSTWLCAIAKNQLSAYLRKHPPMESLEDAEEALELISPAATPEEQVLGRQEKMELLKALHELPEPFREVLYLRSFGELSFAEIGQVLGQTENWARVTFYRGKEKLKKGREKNDE